MIDLGSAGEGENDRCNRSSAACLVFRNAGIKVNIKVCQARHAGYEISQRVRKRVEEIFGWMKTIGLLRKLRHRGEARVEWMFTFTAAVYNLVRARNLLAQAKT